MMGYRTISGAPCRGAVTGAWKPFSSTPAQPGMQVWDEDEMDSHLYLPLYYHNTPLYYRAGNEQIVATDEQKLSRTTT
jgi:hypothetical protein